jgi:hypothetical protein
MVAPDSAISAQHAAVAKSTQHWHPRCAPRRSVTSSRPLLHPRQRRWRLFLDSTALRVLVTAAERCASVIGALILTNVPTRVRRIIHVTGLHTVLIIDTTCDSHTRERT